MFSEIRTTTAISTLDGNHKLYTSLGSIPSTRIGILLHARHYEYILDHHNVSDRVLALDVQFGKRIMRFIAVYIPHAGYTNDELEDTYDSLCYITSSAIDRGYEIIIGGDFNTQIGTIFRGVLLNEFAEAFNLNITNEREDYIEERDWTFCSALGIKRRIDFILASCCFNYFEAAATNDIDMHSDHTAVHMHFQIQRKQKYWRRRKTKIQRGWKPSNIYHEHLKIQLKQ